MRKATGKANAKPKRTRDVEPDVNQLAHHLVEMTTESVEASIAPPPSDDEIRRVMSELGRRGGKIGGRARADSMTPARRKEIAQKAARSRWGATA